MNKLFVENALHFTPRRLLCLQTCTSESLRFQKAHGRDVLARFDGGTLTSDAGALLLREVERATGILRQFTRASPIIATRHASSIP